MPDAREQRRPHVVHVLDLFEDPHLIGKFGRDAALAVAAVAVETVEASKSDAGVVSRAGLPAPVRPVLRNAASEAFSFASREGRHVRGVGRLADATRRTRGPDVVEPQELDRRPTGLAVLLDRVTVGAALQECEFLADVLPLLVRGELLECGNSSRDLRP